MFFVIGILVYFLGSGFWALAIGMAFHAVGKSGGKVLWSLWVTRFAEAEHVSEYMSVHTFLTGVRGLLAPVIAFSIVGTMGPSSVTMIAIVGACLIMVSSLHLLHMKLDLFPSLTLKKILIKYINYSESL